MVVLFAHERDALDFRDRPRSTSSFVPSNDPTAGRPASMGLRYIEGAIELAPALARLAPELQPSIS